MTEPGEDVSPTSAEQAPLSTTMAMESWTAAFAQPANLPVLASFNVAGQTVDNSLESWERDTWEPANLDDLVGIHSTDILSAS
jgi:hypothetical protein